MQHEVQHCFVPNYEHVGTLLFTAQHPTDYPLFQMTQLFGLKKKNKLLYSLHYLL